MKVLITGGSGLIGNRITQLLLKKNIEVVHLTRYKNSKSGVKTYEWDWENEKIDINCFKDVTHIIHLAGAGIADKPWTTKRKRLIVKSRVLTARLISNHIQSLDKLEAFISASGIGYYGAVNSDTIFNEEADPNNDFIAKCCIQWERAADAFAGHTRVVKLRTGIVLDKNEGALPKMASPIKMGIGAPLGDGNQFIPWIHIDDLAHLYIYALENNNIEGVYNATSTLSATNKEFTLTLAKVLDKKIRFKKVPQFLIKAVYGELADLVLKGPNVSNQKIINAGFKFKHENLENALYEIYKKN